jgi:hypothetical protein
MATSKSVLPMLCSVSKIGKYRSPIFLPCLYVANTVCHVIGK